jgi:hypothetical protein
MMAAAGLFFIPSAIAVDAVVKPVVRTSLLVAVVMLMLPTSAIILKETFNGPTKAVAAYINAHADTDVPVIHEDIQTVMPFWHYMPNRKHYLLVPKDDTATTIDDLHPPHKPIVTRDLDAVMNNAKAVWFVDTDLAHVLDVKGVVARSSKVENDSRRFALPYSFTKVWLTNVVM